MTGETRQKPLYSGYGAKTAAADVAREASLGGKLAIVTGGSSGIGFETAKALAAAGATVIVPARDKAKAQWALKNEDGRITVAEMDLGDLASVRKFVRDVKAERKSVHILVCNAGIMACPETRLGKGWEAQFATNHLGHFYLTKELQPLLKSAGGARVVSLSSTAHKRSDVLWDDIHFAKTPYEKWVAYGQSKTANSLFAVGLDARGQKDGVRAFAVHPGGIMTPLQRHLQREEMIELGWIDEKGEIPPAAQPYFKTPEQGAATSVWCAMSPKLEGKGGLYCEDCDVARLADKDSPRYGNVAPWAVDPQSADRLWSETERMLAA